MKKSLLYVSALTFVAMSYPAAAEETVLPADARTNVSVTVYNGGLGLIKDARRVTLKDGVNSIAFEDVSSQMQPETALVSGNGLKVMEQNFNFDLLSRESLLKRFLGKDIKVVNVNPGNGNETTETAKILSVDAGVVLKIGDRIETDYKGRYIFPDVPAALRDKPTLVIDLMVEKVGPQTMELTYLTNGLTWKADYVAELNEKEDKVDLNGWVTLTNTTGVSYPDADLQLVAGAVNRVRAAPRRVMAKGVRLNAMASFDSAQEMVEESLMDYHMYSLGRKTDIRSNQTKQLALLSAPAVSVEKIYRLENVVPTYVMSGSMQDVEMRNAKVFLRFKNDKKSGLGMPLPAGTVRVYKNTGKKGVFFVGEDSVRHTPENEKIDLTLGDAFDVTVSAKQTGYTSLGKNIYNASYALTFKNAKDVPVTVQYLQNFPNTFNIINESVPSAKENASRVKWEITVPAKSSAELTYTVRVSKQ